MASGDAARAFFLLLAASLFAASHAKSIVVGGSKGWRFGVNYTDWALHNQPFYHGDSLVFKYDPPSPKGTHSVYLLPNLWNYVHCDFRGAKPLAGPTQGTGEGFSVVLDKWKPYYFASGEGNGYDCSAGQMKFVALPWPRESIYWEKHEG